VGRRLPRLCAWMRPAAVGFTGAAAQRYHEAFWATTQRRPGLLTSRNTGQSSVRGATRYIRTRLRDT
jgi:hypothetical protein